jgi:hypothetical protein
MTYADTLPEADDRQATPQPVLAGFRCPFCLKLHQPRGDCEHGADIDCCGEVGHCYPDSE